jgi:hypothetical protein
MTGEAKSLSDKIWETRKCRIIASERLNRYSKLSEYLMVFYALIPVVLSILNNKLHSTLIDTASLLSSVVVLVLSVVVSSQKFNDRYQQMKSCYIKLDKLIYQLGKNESSMDDIFIEYNTILDSVENHTNNDHIALKWELRNLASKTVRKITKLECFKHCLNVSIFWVISVLLFSIPLIWSIYLIIRSIK